MLQKYKSRQLRPAFALNENLIEEESSISTQQFVDQ